MRIVLSVILFTATLAAQTTLRSGGLPEDTLATVGSRIITAKDFLERFELMPWPNKDKQDRIEFTKLEFLYSIVAEKLLAMEAAAQNIGFDSATMKVQRNFERMFVRDEYYKSEIRTKVTAPQEEIRIGMSRFPVEIEVAVLGVLSEQEGNTLYTRVSKSKNKRAVLKRFEDSLYVVIDTVKVTYGFPEQAAEDAVFAITADSLSRPVRTEAYGWVMFQMLRRSTNFQNAKFSHPDRLHKVTEIIKQRKEDSIAVRAFAAVTAPQRAEADPALFYRMADSVYAILERDSASLFAKGVFQFHSGAIDQLEQSLAPVAQERLITIASGDMTVDDVLQGLNNNTVVFPAPLNRDHVRIVLNNNIKTVIQNELLTREGFKKNLQQSENVRHDVNVWMDNHRSRQLLWKVLDTLQRAADTLSGKERERYLQDRIDAYIGTLAKQYGVTMDEEGLKQVPVTTHSMVTWRHLGFGGRIIAVPQTVRQFDWYYEWKKQERLNQ